MTEIKRLVQRLRAMSLRPLGRTDAADDRTLVEAAIALETLAADNERLMRSEIISTGRKSLSVRQDTPPRAAASSPTPSIADEVDALLERAARGKTFATERCDAVDLVRNLEARTTLAEAELRTSRGANQLLRDGLARAHEFSEEQEDRAETAEADAKALREAFNEFMRLDDMNATEAKVEFGSLDMYQSALHSALDDARSLSHPAEKK